MQWRFTTLDQPKVNMLYFISMIFLISTSSYSAAGGDTSSNQVTTANTSHTSCQTWFTYNNITSKCECGSLLGGIISCRDKDHLQENSVFESYCMTYDEKLGTVVGLCFNNFISHNGNGVPRIYHRLPVNSSLLNDEMCGNFKELEDYVEVVRKDFNSLPIHTI